MVIKAPLLISFKSEKVDTVINKEKQKGKKRKKQTQGLSGDGSSQEKIKGSYSTQKSNTEPERDQEHYFFLFSPFF